VIFVSIGSFDHQGDCVKVRGTAMKERKRVKGESASSKKAKQQDHPVEQKSSAEWGERIETGKVIARGGKKQGRVKGATEQPR